jgi:hypothetical protein
MMHYINKELSVMDTQESNRIALPKIECDPVLEIAEDQFRCWLSRLLPTSKIGRAIYVDKKNFWIMVKLWTFNNEYGIKASFNEYDWSNCETREKHAQQIVDQGYLGAFSISRKHRAGETWPRGNDLADGKFNEETWTKIVFDIVRYEIEDIKSETWKDLYH